MKQSLLLLLTLALPFSAHAKSELQLKREMQLKISEAYSHCGAYYHLAAKVLEFGNDPGAREAKKMKQSSLTHAVAMATEHVSKRGAKKLSKKHYKKALDDLNLIGKTDSNRFKKELHKYRTSCRDGIEKPHAFIEAVLSDSNNAKPTKVRKPVPSAAEVLKRARRNTAASNPHHCSKSNDTVAIRLNDALLENNKICSDHSNGICNSTQGWRSYEQYVQTLYPARTLLSYSKSSSMTFSNGQAHQSTEISACLAAL